MIGLLLRSTILVWLRIRFLSKGILHLLSAIIESVFSVSIFCERFIVMRLLKNGSIEATPSSVILLRMSLSAFTFVLNFIRSSILRIWVSPNYAFVKSTVSRESFTIPSRTFSYFSGTLKDFSFFFTSSRLKVGVLPISLVGIAFYLTVKVDLFFFTRALPGCYLFLVIISSLVLIKLSFKIWEFDMDPTKDSVSN